MNPTYSHDGKVVGPGPANPVGTRWMSIGYKGYGIHGTNHPESIGHAASHGCIRMRNRMSKNCLNWCEWATRWI
jgi:lipoprotein-anchoring transpeptidase ErfK/SrfK